MLSARYHIATIIAIFLSLGIGIVIGGTLGQRWAVQAENTIVDMLTDRYEMMLAENQVMKKQIGSLELFLKTVSPSVQNKIVWWLKHPEHDEESLAMVLHAAGVRWVEKDVSEYSPYAFKVGETQPDYILVTDPAVKHQIEEQLRARIDEDPSVMESRAWPQLIDVSERTDQLTEPDKIVEFMLYMKQLVEEEAYAATNAMDLRHHAGME